MIGLYFKLRITKGDNQAYRGKERDLIRIFVVSRNENDWCRQWESTWTLENGNQKRIAKSRWFST